MRGAGRSTIGGPGRAVPQAMELAQVHQVVDAGEEEPLAAAQATDQRVVERARLGFVAGDRLG
jgi:hypothetical protein